jgi:hypothetical protein
MAFPFVAEGSPGYISPAASRVNSCYNGAQERVMKLERLYKKAIEIGIANDPRGAAEIKRLLDRKSVV